MLAPLAGLLTVYRRTVIPSVLAALAACGPPPIRVTQTGHKHPPRGANCEFALLTVPPAGNFVEIGAIDVYMAVFELDKFKSIISPHVCDAGGDAAVAFATATARTSRPPS
jgi:hypothetical protein